MRRRLGRHLATLALLLLVAQPARAALLSKSFHFKKDVILEVGAATDNGLRLDSIKFQAYTRRDPAEGGPVRAEVAISNSSSEAQRVGIAMALFDGEGRLVGVASGGSKVLAIKPGRQSVYTLIFKDVNTLAPGASTFQITVEPR